MGDKKKVYDNVEEAGAVDTASASLSVEDNEEADKDELRLKNLAEELKAVVKEVQWYKYWGKKKELENMNKEKNDKKKGVEGDEDYNNYEN
jgi:DNA-binding transcriptional regulator YhcF (GntR family)